MRTPVAAWASIVEDPAKRAAYTRKRGLGGFVRADWDEVDEIIAAANAYTAKTYGPDRVIGFSPIPAMSMVSYAAGSRYLSLLGGVCMSFYDWYCDLPPASPADLGRADRRAGERRLVQFRLPDPVGLERAADAHARRALLHRGPLQGRQERRHLPGLLARPPSSPTSGCSAKQGTDAALAMAMGHVILREFHVDRQAEYFEDYARQYTDMPMLVRLVKQGDRLVPDRLLRASDFAGDLGETNNPEWKTVAFDETSESIVVPHGSVGFRWGEKGKWNLEEKEAERPRDQPAAELRRRQGRARRRRLPLFRQPRARALRRHRPSERAGAQRAGQARAAEGRRGAGRHRVRPVRRQLRRSTAASAATHVAKSYDDERALHAGLGREDHRRAARPDHPGRARVRAQRREDQGPLDGHPRRRR